MVTDLTFKCNRETCTIIIFWLEFLSIWSNHMIKLMILDLKDPALEKPVSQLQGPERNKSASQRR